jgi:hypothetical protein
LYTGKVLQKDNSTIDEEVALYRDSTNNLIPYIKDSSGEWTVEKDFQEITVTYKNSENKEVEKKYTAD